jgi:hypothetical protein
MIDLVALTFSYGCGWYLNYLQAREASVTAIVRSGTLTNSSAITTAIDQIENQWATTGLGQFTHPTNITQACCLVNPGNAGNPLSFVQITTTLTVDPLLKIPGCGYFPGLGSSVTFTYAGQRPVEDII